MARRDYNPLEAIEIASVARATAPAAPPHAILRFVQSDSRENTKTTKKNQPFGLRPFGPYRQVEH